MTLLGRAFDPGDQRANLIVRLLVGFVFFPEGVKKFLFAAQWGAGRFERIGIPAPAAMAAFVGTVEIACGLFLIAGLATRVASVALLADIIVAIATTKIPLLWRPTAVASKIGFWSMQSEARTDYAMLMGLLFLLLAGAGPWSLDGVLRREPRRRPSD